MKTAPHFKKFLGYVSAGFGAQAREERTLNITSPARPLRLPIWTPAE